MTCKDENCKNKAREWPLYPCPCSVRWALSTCISFCFLSFLPWTTTRSALAWDRRPQEIRGWLDATSTSDEQKEGTGRWERPKPGLASYPPSVWDFWCSMGIVRSSGSCFWGGGDGRTWCLWDLAGDTEVELLIWESKTGRTRYGFGEPVLFAFYFHQLGEEGTWPFHWVWM